MAIQAASTLSNRIRRLAAGCCRVGKGLPAKYLRNRGAMRSVALLAQERYAHLKHGIGSGAVRVVANRAIFGHRLVVMHERPALLHMAGVAGIVDAIALHHLWSDRTVRIMAIGTSHFPFGDGMAGGAVDLSALLFMAGETYFGLCLLVANLVVFNVNLVAGVARYVAALVGAAVPVRTIRVALVAIHAHLAAHLRGCHRMLFKFDIGLSVPALVFLAFAMAAGACRRARIGLGAVLGLPDRHHLGKAFRLMALRTFRVPVEDKAFLGVVRECGCRDQSGATNKCAQKHLP